MAGLNALQRALVQSGLAEEPKARKPRYKQSKCHRCKHVMTKVPDSNIMFCEQCGQYFLFDRVM